MEECFSGLFKFGLAPALLGHKSRAEAAPSSRVFWRSQATAAFMLEQSQLCPAIGLIAAPAFLQAYPKGLIVSCHRLGCRPRSPAGLPHRLACSVCFPAGMPKRIEEGL